MKNLHYIADEQLGGVEREYAEVERKANVGDYAIQTSTWEMKQGIIAKVARIASDDSGIRLDGEPLFHSEYATLDPTGNVRIDGKVYRMVERNADVGERVLITESEVDGYEPGEIYDVIRSNEITVGFLDQDDELNYAEHHEYVAVEPINQAPADGLTLTEADVCNNPRQVIDLIANLALRVTTLEKGADRLSKLESKVERLGTANQQAYDIVSRNVETWAQEMAELKAKQSTSFGTFDFSQLGGKTLKIVTGVDMADGVTCTTVIGYDEEDGKYYVLDTKIEGRSLTAEERREL